MWAKLNRFCGIYTCYNGNFLIRVWSLPLLWMDDNKLQWWGVPWSVPCVCAVGVQCKVLRLCCMAGGRFLSSARVGGGGCPILVARVGRLCGWRSLGCAVMSTQKDKLRLRCLFCAKSAKVVGLCE